MYGNKIVFSLLLFQHQFSKKKKKEKENEKFVRKLSNYSFLSPIKQKFYYFSRNDRNLIFTFRKTQIRKFCENSHFQ